MMLSQETLVETGGLQLDPFGMPINPADFLDDYYADYDVSRVDDFDDNAAAEGSLLGDRIRAAGLTPFYRDLELNDYQLGALMVFALHEHNGPFVVWLRNESGEHVGWINMFLGGWETDPENELLSVRIGNKNHLADDVQPAVNYEF